jgi:hypothetical protein
MHYIIENTYIHEFTKLYIKRVNLLLSAIYNIIGCNFAFVEPQTRILLYLLGIAVPFFHNSCQILKHDLSLPEIMRWDLLQRKTCPVLSEHRLQYLYIITLRRILFSVISIHSREYNITGWIKSYLTCEFPSKFLMTYSPLLQMQSKLYNFAAFVYHFLCDSQTQPIHDEPRYLLHQV